MTIMPSEFCGGNDGTTPYQPKYSGETVPGEWRWWERLTPFPKLEPKTDEYNNHFDPTRSTPSTTTTHRPAYQTPTQRTEYPSWNSATTSSYTTSDKEDEFTFSGEEEKEDSFYQEEFISSGEFYVTKPVNDRPVVEDFISVKNPDHGDSQNILQSTEETVKMSQKITATTPNPAEVPNSIFSLPADAPYGSNKMECFFHPTTLNSNTRDVVK